MRVRADIITAMVLGILFLGICVLTVPENHSEADNAFHYAWNVEKAPVAETLHRHHLLYIPLAKAVHAGARLFSADVRAYPVMIALSMIAGAIALAFLFLTLRRHLGFSSDVSFFSVGLIGASYGFWRYACEAEIPVVAAAPLAIAIFILTCPRINALGVLGAAVAAAAAVMLHILALIPALLALPALLMGRGRRASLLIYLLLLMALIVAGYTIADTSPFAEAAHSQSEYGDVRLTVQGPSALGNAALGFGRALLSGNYLFCLHPFREFLVRVFSHRLLREELLIGVHAGATSVVLPLVILLLLGLVGIFVADDRLNPHTRDKEEDTPPPPHPFAAIRHVALIAMAIWFIVHSLFLLGHEPANPENWILVCVPFWLGIILMWARDRRGIPPQALGTLFILLLLHNYFGGMHLVADEASDYNRRSSQWAIDHVRTGDAILTNETPAYCWYLRYHTPAQVIWLPHTESLPELVESLHTVRRQGGHVLATPDVFPVTSGWQHGSPCETENVIRTRKALRPLFVPVSRNRFGMVWLFRPEN